MGITLTSRVNFSSGLCCKQIPMAADQLWKLFRFMQYPDASESFRRLQMSREVIKNVPLWKTETSEQAAYYRSDEVVGIGRRFNAPFLGTSC